MKKPLISVIIPVYNGEDFLDEAVQSIYRQNYNPIEIVIVDDGSTDNSSKLAAGYRGNVRYFYQPNSGPAAARNRGLSMATGNVIGFLDADDMWCENKLRRQLEYFRNDPSLDIVLGLLQLMRLNGADEGKNTFEKWSEPVMSMHLGSALFRRSIFEKVGFFDESLDHCEDCDWFMRAKEKRAHMIIHREVTYYYRRHSHNMTNDLEKNLAFALKMLRHSLKRRRRQNNGGIEQLPKLSDFPAKHAGYSHPGEKAKK